MSELLFYFLFYYLLYPLGPFTFWEVSNVAVCWQVEHSPVKTDARPFLLSLHSIMEPSQFLACLATSSVYSFIFSTFTILLPCPNEELSSLLLNCWSLFLASTLLVGSFFFIYTLLLLWVLHFLFFLFFLFPIFC